ncbi:MAG: RagB/SusD family nutrient uptake outer membrane protein, partial [Prevotella sp.]|nr:RagB/SusD family nutrient uptake outer membrane protein [Prevotella sp.]
VELWGEGFQWSDFKRWKLPIVRHTFAEGGNAHPAVAVTIQPNDPITNNWTWVVPANETDYNAGFKMGEESEK